MLFFSRVTFISNTAFLLMLLFRFLEMRRDLPGKPDGLLGYQPLVGTLVVLGHSALLLNLILCVFLLLAFIRKSPVSIPRWLQWSSIIFLMVQFLYFFG